MDDNLVERLSTELDELKSERVDLLPGHGTLNDIIADTINALEVAYVVINALKYEERI